MFFSDVKKEETEMSSLCWKLTMAIFLLLSIFPFFLRFRMTLLTPFSFFSLKKGKKLKRLLLFRRFYSLSSNVVRV